MSVATTLKSVVKKLPGVREVVAERDRLRMDCGFVPPGHFYSPIPSLADVRANDARIFDNSSRTIPGIELNEAAQLQLLEHWRSFYQELPFPRTKTSGLRYYFENPAYSYSDAIM